jgi:hypothetical protein
MSRSLAENNFQAVAPVSGWANSGDENFRSVIFQHWVGRGMKTLAQRDERGLPVHRDACKISVTLRIF